MALQPTPSEIKAMTDLICICGLRCTCGARQRLQSIREEEANQIPPGYSPTDRTLYDGHGTIWEKCDRVDCGLHVVRPGKAQCPCED